MREFSCVGKRGWSGWWPPVRGDYENARSTFLENITPGKTNYLILWIALAVRVVCRGLQFISKQVFRLGPP